MSRKALRRYNLDALVEYVKRHPGTKQSQTPHPYGHAEVWKLHTVEVSDGISNRDGKIWTQVTVQGVVAVNRSGTWTGKTFQVLALAKTELNIHTIEAIELPYHETARRNP